jgi:molybdenum cofactor synthesis domain-containing protein
VASTAAIIVIGNEVLSGKVDDENARYLIRELRTLGVQLIRVSIIRDELETIAEEVRKRSAEATYVFTSGGVGATHDDLTMEGVARAFGVKLKRHPALLELLEARYVDRKTDNVLRMADVPEGTELVGLGEQLFPIVKVKNVYVFPGVPAYLKMKFEYLKAGLKENAFVLKQIFVKVGEAAIAEMMTETQNAHPGVEIGSYPRFDGADHRVKITIESRDESAVAEAVAVLLSRFDPAWVVRVE